MKFPNKDKSVQVQRKIPKRCNIQQIALYKCDIIFRRT